jgi:alpha/beta superfamily hydrolase
MLHWIKDHPAESLALALALFNFMAKVAVKIAGTNPEASKTLSFISALGPDVVNAFGALTKKAPPPDEAITAKELPLS